MKPQRVSLAIIGAGPGGLTLAKHLAELGFNDFVVLEKSGRVGGKADSVAVGQAIAELGTCYATTAHRHILRWMTSQNTKYRRVARTSVDGANFMAYIKRAAGPPLLSQMVKYLHLRRNRLERLAESVDDPLAVSEAAMSTRDWLARHNLPKIERLMYRSMTSLGYGFLDETPMIHAWRWTDWDTIYSGARGLLFMPTGGWQQFWTELSRPLNVRLDTEITSIVREGGRAKIATRSGDDLLADQIVCTIPLDEFAKLTPLTTSEASVADAITWMGYVTTLVAADNWFKNVDVQSFSSSFLPGSMPGRLLSARYELHSPDLGGDLYVVGQLPGVLSRAELRESLEADLSAQGARLNASIESKQWRYFPRYSSDAIESGLLRTMACMQGENATWYTGATFSHESVANISNFNETLARRILNKSHRRHKLSLPIQKALFPARQTAPRPNPATHVSPLSRLRHPSE